MYNIIIQKPNPSISKHIPRVQELCNLSNKPEIDFNNIPHVKSILDDFLNNNKYTYKKPNDIGVGFHISTNNPTNNSINNSKRKRFKKMRFF